MTNIILILLAKLKNSFNFLKLLRFLESQSKIFRRDQKLFQEYIIKGFENRLICIKNMKNLLRNKNSKESLIKDMFNSYHYEKYYMVKFNLIKI